MWRPVFTFKQYLNEYVEGNWGYNDLLKEALTQQEKGEVDSWSRGDYSFSDHAFGGDKTQLRTVIPVESERTAHPDVVDHLSQHGYKISDYDKGLARDANGREMKIGKVLEKTKAPNKIFSAYENDPNRSALGKTASQFPSSDLQVVISRHPHDIASMSTDRGWESCMNMRGGCNSHYLSRDVQEGTHVSFLTKKGDDTAEEPLARIAIKPFYGDQTSRKILHPEGRIYSTENGFDSRFTGAVRKWTEQNFPKGDKEVFKKSKDVYDDDGEREVGTMEAMLNHPSDNVRAKAYQKYSHKITPEHIERTLSRSFSGAEREAALSHPKTSSEVLDREWDKTDDYAKRHILKNPNAPQRAFSEGMKLGTSARMIIAQNPSAPKEVLHELLHSRDEVVASHASYNPSTTRESRLSAFSDEKVPINTKVALVNYDHFNAVDRVFKARHLESVMKDVVEEPYAEDHTASMMQHVNATPKMFEMVLNSPNRKASINIMNRNPENISKDGWRSAINNDNKDVRNAAIEATPHAEHHKEIYETHSSNPVSSSVRDSISRNPHVSSDTIHDLLRSENTDVRVQALYHKKHTSEHVEVGMNDPEPRVRAIAAKSMRATEEHLDRAMADPDPRVRAGVGMNPYAGNDRKRILANDPHPAVASAFEHYRRET